MVVIVGPNGAGKSLFLREMNEQMHGAPVQRGAHRILISYETGPKSVRALRLLIPPNPSEQPFFLRNFLTGGGAGVGPDDIRRLYEEDQPDITAFVGALEHVGRLFIAGVERFSYIQPQAIGNAKEPPMSSFRYLQSDLTLRGRLSSMFEEAFHRHLLFDPTNAGTLNLVASDVGLPDPDLEYSFRPTAVDFFQRCVPLAQMSDGIKAYTSLLIAVLTTFRHLLLIDEPEVFLHPVLANKLGGHLTTLAVERDATVIVATHSADFLFGAIQADRPMSIVRLTYDGHSGASQVLDHSALRPLMHDPVLRSIGTLAALFYEGAIVCEGDSDRVFYQEINERLSRTDGSGCGNSIFLQGYSWQRIHRIVRPLRSLGVPAAAIVDFDTVLSDDLNDLLSACWVPDASIKGFGQTRGDIRGHVKRGKMDYKGLGLGCLASSEREAAELLLSNLREYGIFVVPVGEVECWLRELDIRVEKSSWVAAMLERLAEGDQVTQPGPGDVWAFLRNVARWIKAEDRKGMGN